MTVIFELVLVVMGVVYLILFLKAYNTIDKQDTMIKAQRQMIEDCWRICDGKDGIIKGLAEKDGAAYAKLERAIRHDSICGCCIYRGRSYGEELYESKDWGYGCKSWEFARLAEQEGDTE